MKQATMSLTLLIIMASISLSACSTSENRATAARGIESYHQALVAKDSDQLSNYSCAYWEAQARLELESFGAVEAELNDLECTDAGQDGEATLVSCTGKIIAAYGNEILEINLADRQYLAVFEGNEWRMCGYR